MKRKTTNGCMPTEKLFRFRSEVDSDLEVTTIATATTTVITSIEDAGNPNSPTTAGLTNSNDDVPIDWDSDYNDLFEFKEGDNAIC